MLFITRYSFFHYWKLFVRWDFPESGPSDQVRSVQPLHKSVSLFYVLASSITSQGRYPVNGINVSCGFFSKCPFQYYRQATEPMYPWNTECNRIPARDWKHSLQETSRVVTEGQELDDAVISWHTSGPYVVDETQERISWEGKTSSRPITALCWLVFWCSDGYGCIECLYARNCTRSGICIVVVIVVILFLYSTDVRAILLERKLSKLRHPRVTYSGAQMKLVVDMTYAI